MKINNISIHNQGYVNCKSSFYSAQDILSGESLYTFSKGVNKLVDEIDSGHWAISYMISMYKHQPEDFILFNQPVAEINNKFVSLNELSDYSCYMDILDPLFSSDETVKELVMRGLTNSGSGYSCDDVKKLFCIDSERFERSLSGVGNEIFKAMAAIGFSYGKEIFCFPWLSKMRFDGYHCNLTDLLNILEGLNKIVIVPVGK